jgi:acid phosphatase (class A)
MNFYKLSLLVVLFSAAAWGTNGPPEPQIVSKDSIVTETALPQFPAHGSRAEGKDFKKMLKLQNTRTMEECNRAAAVATNYKLSNLFGKPYGPLSDTEVASLEKFFDSVQSDINYFSYQEKTHFNRKRPYAENDAVVPCPNVKKENSPAYPSGHTTVARVFARLLSKIDPSRKHEFKARGDQIAMDRVMSGLHHPSDIEAGKKLGDEVYGALMKNESFTQQVSDLREWMKL